MSVINLASFIAATEAEGPFTRAALWVQGCRKVCPGCCNPQMQPIVPRQLAPVEEVWNWISAARRDHGIEGITLLGGEPVLQAKGLSKLAQRCRFADIGVILFTGYTMRELESSALPGLPELIAATDLVIAGPYLATQPETSRAWVGSANQKIVHRSGRYPVGIAHELGGERTVEVRISTGGVIRLNGWPDASAFGAIDDVSTLE